MMQRRLWMFLYSNPKLMLIEVTVLGHSEGTVMTPRVAIDNPDKVKNIVLIGALHKI